MMKRDHTYIRILGIDPCTRGYGFAVFDVPHFLADWGVAKLRGKKFLEHRTRLEAMIERFKPDIVVLPDPADRKQNAILRKLVDTLGHSTSMRISLRVVSMDAVRNAFPSDARTKYQRAEVLVKALPELHELLPRPRKIWESEDARMNIFDALCLVFALPERAISTPKAARQSPY
jgi:RNase H-fold protein (predicted Holliday junction resolvase)